jgi:hypothetical protein
LDRLDLFEIKLGKELASTDTGAIKFGSLGFRTPVEAFALLAIECPSNAFGLLVDPHMVLKHVFANINGVNVLKSMETLCKIKLTTVSEGLAISSFERDIPKFFSVAGHRVVKSNESYWSKIVRLDSGWCWP